MRIEFKQETSDHDLPCIDIHFESKEEAFKVGRVFETIVERGLTSWSINGGIRIPLVIANNLGLVDADKTNRL